MEKRLMHVQQEKSQIEHEHMISGTNTEKQVKNMYNMLQKEFQSPPVFFFFLELSMIIDKNDWPRFRFRS